MLPLGGQRGGGSRKRGGTPMNFGPDPWQQSSWDWRAAGNFICGGAGAGLIVTSAFSGVQGPALTALMLAGLALVGLGLSCVWLEIGRPLRAINVFFNPKTSWMSREAITATLLFPAGLGAAAGISGFAWAAAALALAFVYCQSRMLQAARGIPAWREPLLSPLIVITGLAEGAGLFLVTGPILGPYASSLAVPFGVLLLARILMWLAYRRRLAGAAASRANLALDRAGRVLQVAGTLAPLALIAVTAAGDFNGTLMPLAASLAGLAATLAGSYLKYVLVTSAGFNQGFALEHLPVRGARP